MEVFCLTCCAKCWNGSKRNLVSTVSSHYYRFWARLCIGSGVRRIWLPLSHVLGCVIDFAVRDVMTVVQASNEPRAGIGNQQCVRSTAVLRTMP